MVLRKFNSSEWFIVGDRDLDGKYEIHQSALFSFHHFVLVDSSEGAFVTGP